MKWLTGRTNGYRWQAQVFEHGSHYGIQGIPQGSRVSRLCIHNAKEQIVYNYDRGLDFKHVSKRLIKVIVAQATSK